VKLARVMGWSNDGVRRMNVHSLFVNSVPRSVIRSSTLEMDSPAGPVVPFSSTDAVQAVRLRYDARSAACYGDDSVVSYYFEDFEPGQTFSGSTRIGVDTESIRSFAAEFDPQPFHLDEDAAKDTIFSGLAASGWHTSAITMRLLVDSDLKVAGGLVGLGLEELKWPRPVRPGDELRVQAEILDVRGSRSRPQQGLVRVRNTTLNQRNEVVQVSVSTLIVPRRPNAAAAPEADAAVASERG
jgi:acyl dehydratase